MTAILYDAAGAVAAITLNRPDRLNAINTELLTGLHEALLRASRDESVRVIFLRGSGRAFCAGDDLDEFSKMSASGPGPHIEGFVALLQNVTRLMMLGEKPVVCAVQGPAVGGGAAWPLNADLTFWSDDAALYCPEARYGMFVSGGMSILLAERCGLERARRITWLGERVSGQRLVADRIATTLVERKLLDAEARRAIDKLLAPPAESLRRFKQAQAASLRDRLEAALQLEAAAMVEAANDPRVPERLPKSQSRSR